MMEDLSRDFMQEGAKNERERILKLMDKIDTTHGILMFKKELKKRING